MSCNKVNNCKKYKMNIGNPNDWESPCNRCHYNISDYDIGYNKAIDDFAEKLSIAFDETDIEEYGFYPKNLVRMVAEQLKAGGENA